MGERMLMRAGNGGFPEPPPGEPQRLVGVRHAACGAETRVRLPRQVPAGAVRRVVCRSCSAAYECEHVEELGVMSAEAASAAAERAPAEAEPPAAPVRPPAPPASPASEPGPTAGPRASWMDSRAWRWGSVLVAAAAVTGALLLVQGGARDPSREVGSTKALSGGPDRRAPTDARYVTEPGFSLALPPGWDRLEPRGGAAFAARPQDGGATATLWIQRDPGLSFEEFERRSLAELSSLAGSAKVTDRVAAPTIEGSIVRLGADASTPGAPAARYDVTLRAAGPYRYYLSTTVEPGASREASAGAELIHGSFLPEPGGGSRIATGGPPGSAQISGAAAAASEDEAP